MGYLVIFRENQNHIMLRSLTTARHLHSSPIHTRTYTHSYIPTLTNTPHKCSYTHTQTPTKFSLHDQAKLNKWNIHASAHKLIMLKISTKFPIHKQDRDILMRKHNQEQAGMIAVPDILHKN